ncbi:MAG: hypothetical protein AAGM04_06040 [Pseudomonadota bacterium]
MALRVVQESAETLDYAAVGRAITAAYAARNLNPPPHDLKWRYLRGFGQRPTIFAVYQDDVRIGQAVVLVRQLADGRRIALLADLYVDAGPSSALGAMMLYKELKAFLETEPFSLIYTLANETAGTLDRKILGLVDKQPLAVTPGLFMGFGSHSGSQLGGARWGSSLVKVAHAKDAQDMVAPLEAVGDKCDAPGTLWIADDLLSRLGAPCHRYLAAKSGGLLLIAVPRRFGVVPTLVLSARFGAGDAKAWRAALAQLVRLSKIPLVLNGTGVEVPSGLLFSSLAARFSRTFAISYRLGPDGEDLPQRLQFLDLDVM